MPVETVGYLDRRACRSGEKGLYVNWRAYVHARLGAMAARGSALLRNATLRHFVTGGCALIAHFRAQLADVSGKLRLTPDKIGARLAHFGAVFRRLYSSRIYATARLQRHTAFLALPTSFDALLRFSRNRLGHQQYPSGI
jgi:hypothetical protein